jgi:cyclic peptide transporter
MDIRNGFNERSVVFYISLMFLGIVNGASHSGLLLFINKMISNESKHFSEYDGLIFFALIVLSFCCSKLFQSYMVNLTKDIVFKFELSVIQRLRGASFEAFEKIATEKVYTALGDTKILGTIPEAFINAFNSFVTVLCGVVYLFWVSFWGGVVVLVLMTSLLILYVTKNKKIEKDLVLLRELQNNYYKYLNDLLWGFKEVKMSNLVNQNLYNNFLKNNRVEDRTLSKKTSLGYLNNELIGNYSWYIILGTIMFILTKIFGLNVGQMTSFIITVLYLISPVGTLISLVPTYTHVKIARARLKEFDKNLGTAKNGIESAIVRKTDQEFKSIRFENVCYKYYDRERKKSFSLGPINVKISRGEIIFITGENGSGKSTFIKVITGLYQPTSGNIYINDSLVTSENFNCYKSYISVVFANNYLFNENYEEYNLNKSNKKLIDYMSLMKLTPELLLNEEKNIFKINLSKGQQKRLGMITVLMENREVVVLDEWAAEQDPEFRDYFYNQFLSILKGYKKTILAVTHDDVYYGNPDRIIKFQLGKISSDLRIEKGKKKLQKI